MVVEVVNGQSEVGEAKAKTAALASATTSSRRHMSDTRPEIVRRQSASPIEQPKIPTIAIMTENRAPAEPQPSATSAADQPGRPYYEQLRTTLRGTLDKKRKLDEQLAALEDQIFKLEGAYLEETSNSGNIVRGFDGWVKGVSVGGRAGDDRRRGRVRDEDRVFSHSSVGWMKVSICSFHQLEMRKSLRMLTKVDRRKKAQIRIHRHMQLHLPAPCRPPCHAQKALPVLLARLETRRREPRTRTTMTRRRQSVGRSHTRGSKRPYFFCVRAL